MHIGKPQSQFDVLLFDTEVLGNISRCHPLLDHCRIGREFVGRMIQCIRT